MCWGEYYRRGCFLAFTPGGQRRFLAIGAAIALALGLVSADGAELGARTAPGGYLTARLTPMDGVQHVTITVNKSATFKVDHAFRAATVGAPEIIDARPLSDKVIYLQGKKIGTTNVSLFDQDAQLISVIDIEVVPDVAVLRSKLRNPGMNRIQVSAAGEQVVLSGVAADAVSAERAVEVAKGFAGKNVVNAMQVAPSQQVMLEVRFLEASRTTGRELGVALYGANGNGAGFRTGTTTQLGVNATTPATPSGIPILATAGALLSGGTPFGSFVGRLVSTNNFNVDILLNALEQKGLIRRLAEPNLVALSGDSARFLAGGEFPIPIPQTTSTGIPNIAIEYKKFGVELKFTPTVLSNGIVDLRIFPSVSELDFSTPLQIAGFTVPAITKRDAETRVELRDGQSFAIAGLLASEGRRNVSQLPWIGSVPVLGALFRSPSFQNNETDLVIIVTPHLVSPAAPNEKLASPLDSRLPGNDVDFFLNGQPEVKKKYRDFVAHGGGGKGPYGHIIPVYGAAVATPPESAPLIPEPVVTSKE